MSGSSNISNGASTAHLSWTAIDPPKSIGIGSEASIGSQPVVTKATEIPRPFPESSSRASAGKKIRQPPPYPRPFSAVKQSTDNSTPILSPEITSSSLFEPLTKFELFPKLPMELRLKIYKDSRGPRTIEVRFQKEPHLITYKFMTDVPIELLICHESRIQALKSYKITFRSMAVLNATYFNAALDTLHVSCFGTQNQKRVFYDAIQKDMKNIQNLAISQKDLLAFFAKCENWTHPRPPQPVVASLSKNWFRMSNLRELTIIQEAPCEKLGSKMKDQHSKEKCGPLNRVCLRDLDEVRSSFRVDMWGRPLAPLISSSQAVFLCMGGSGGRVPETFVEMVKGLDRILDAVRQKIQQSGSPTEKLEIVRKVVCEMGREDPDRGLYLVNEDYQGKRSKKWVEKNMGKTMGKRMQSETSAALSKGVSSVP